MKKRVLFVGNYQIRRWGAGRPGADQRLHAGAVRLNLPSLIFSERDIVRFLSPVFRNIGGWLMNRFLVRTAKNFCPDVIFISHCDYVTNEALLQIRRALPKVRIAHLNVDALALEHCRMQLDRRKSVCDALFVTTAGDRLSNFCTGRNVVGYMPNPCDECFETEDCSQAISLDNDVFFAGSLGHPDERRVLLDEILAHVDKSVKMRILGMGFTPLMFGLAYDREMVASKMGLSLNHYEGQKWYASDRLAHLMGNGLLTFQYEGNDMQHFFSEKETVYFHSPADLAEKILYYHDHDDERRAIAAAGRKRYHELFNSARVLKYLIETTCGEPYSEQYE